MDLSNNITYFGETDARNKRIRFGIKTQDRLRHFYVIGKTGVGKSTLLENMAIQDIQNGEGVAFIDPHGSTAEKLLDYVPEHRIKDVLYFAPFDLENPISFNVLEDVGIDKRHLVVNGLMSTFEKIWEDAWSARMAYILNNTLLALLEYPGATLLGVNRMYADKEFRKKVVENIKDVSVKTFWTEEYAKYTDKYAQEATPAIQNKIGQFTSNPLVRNMIGQAKSSFDIRDFMDRRKILLINLSKGLVGEGNAKLIGSMLITKIYLAAMSRADKNKEELSKLPNFYLYVDEFQSFANKSFADILSEARKYKLSLNITHQYIEQMEEEVRDAVFGNVGTMVTFRVGAFDAEVLEKEFSPTFTAEDLVNLGFAQIYLKLMIDGVSSQPFSASTMGPIPQPEKIYKKEILESSHSQFTRPRAEVEAEIVSWHAEGIKEEKPKERKDFFQGGQENRPRKFEGQSQQRPRDNYQAPRQNVDEGSNNFRRDDRPREDMRERSFDRPIQPVQTVQPIQPVQKPLERPEYKNEMNKNPFLKVTAELKTRGILNEQKETISLSQLSKDREVVKNPTNQNISGLKDAISNIVKKSPEQAPPPVRPAPNPIVSEKKVEEKVPQPSSSKEISEDVLRKILEV